MDIKLLLILSALILNSEQLFLKQVLILSRHNVRTPLSTTLSQCSPKSWPTWSEKPGYLTPKGALLEGYMGEYFHLWLNKEKLLPQECPNEKEFYVYSNTAQRTLASAQAFTTKAFPTCNITIHHANKVDPIFNAVLHNETPSFLHEVSEIMKNQLNNLHLNQSFNILEQMLDYKHSDNCMKEHKCHLDKDENTPTVRTGSKPNIKGPIKISKSAIDSFIMEYYEDLNNTEVAWGLLSTDEKWRSILDISYIYHNIIFNTTIIAKDISKPLLTYMANILSNNENKITLLMGHDANIYTVLNAMGFKPFNLKRQHERTPIGGKIVFQRWSDNNTQDFLKIDYVYQASEQMREGVKLTLENPPILKKLELYSCTPHENGLCPWDTFIKILNGLIK